MLLISTDDDGANLQWERATASTAKENPIVTFMDYLQKIDPCGLVDEDSLRRADFGFTSYGYRAFAVTGQYNSCQIDTVSGARVTLLIDDSTPYRETDSVYVTSGMTFKMLDESAAGPDFVYVGYLGLDTGAPRGEGELNPLEKFRITVMAHGNDDISAKELATFATDMVARVRLGGVPTISEHKASKIIGFDTNPRSFGEIFSDYGYVELVEESDDLHHCRYYDSDRKTWVALRFHPIVMNSRSWEGKTRKVTPAGEIYLDEGRRLYPVSVLLGDSYKINYLNSSVDEAISQVPGLSVWGETSFDMNIEIAQKVQKSLLG